MHPDMNHDSMSPDTMSHDDLTTYRDRFPILEQSTYLVSHSLGAMPSDVHAALEEYAAVAGRPAPTSTTPGKSTRTGTLLAVFLGGFGAHRFYLGDKKGLLYLPFFWTLVPSVISLIEAFFMPDRVRAYNRRTELVEAVRAHKLLTAGHPPALPGGRTDRRPCPMCAELILPEARICRYCGSSVG